MSLPLSSKPTDSRLCPSVCIPWRTRGLAPGGVSETQGLEKVEGAQVLEQAGRLQMAHLSLLSTVTSGSQFSSQSSSIFISNTAGVITLSPRLIM